MNRLLLKSALLIAAFFGLIGGGLYLASQASGSEMFMPHAHCYLFNRELMRLHGGSDLFIGLSYVAISTTLVWLVYRARRELPFNWMMIAFAIFIVACGATHLMEVWTLTAAHPPYWIAGWIKLLTAAASLTTAIVLPPLIPRVLSLLKAARLSAQRGEKLEHAYRDLNALYARVTQLDELKTAFFANVSHELRTPLSLIFAPVERLLQTAREPATRRELSVVRRNALWLHKHVNDLLDVSKLEVGKMELHYSRLDLAAMTRGVAGIFESVVTERGIRVVVETPRSMVAEVDGDKLQRVLMNLLSNAFKYAPDESSVHLSLSEEGDLLTLAVEDSGPGVPPELRHSIFERFQQGDKETKRRFGGTGLGLSIVKEFVEMHGGSISVGESAWGGARFWVRLPRRAPDGTEVHGSPWIGTDPVLQRLASSSTGERISVPEPVVLPSDQVRPEILVVEDNSDMRDFICRVLEEDAMTRTAADGEAALKAIRERIPDLVLTDLMMPIMTGAELISALRADENLHDLPVILLTAKADDQLKLNLLTAGAQDYVMKPFSVDELRARVRNQLQTKATRDMLRSALDSRSENVATMVQELAAAKAAAEAANAAKDEFLAVLSHELRTPLTPALAAASGLLNTPPTDPQEFQELMRIISRNIELEARLVDDLLDVTRIAHGKLQLRSAPVTLHEILRDALAMTAPSLRKMGVGVVLDFSKEQPLVRGDSARLAQVFANLLSNAAKFSPESGEVTVRTTVFETSVRVDVIDHGIGIAPEILPRIFEPFRQGAPGTARRFGGLGLGLSVAKGLVEAHGGTIGACSPGPEPGATFSVELPLLERDTVLSESPAHAKTNSGTSRSVRILLVEDHEDTRLILQRLMTRWGNKVITASTVAEARAHLAQESFDLVLSDLGLPDGSGYDVIATLRESSQIPAVAMSGYGMEDDLARTRAAGFSAHLVKPVLAAALQELIGRTPSANVQD